MEVSEAMRKKYEESIGERWGCLTVHPEIVCTGCRYSHGEPPWADLPEKSYCMVYRREDGIDKPRDVYFEGKPCEFYEPE